VIDATGEVLIPLTIIHSSINAFTITFSASTSGNILASVGSPQLQTYLSTAANYTGVASDYFVEFTAVDKTFTFLTEVGRTGKTLVLVNGSSGQLSWNTTSSQTVSGALTGTMQSKSALMAFSNGTNWIIGSQYYVPDGWLDLFPVSFKDDGANGWAFEEIGATGRFCHTAAGSAGLKRLHFKHHIPHMIKLGATEAHVHIHGESEDAGAGNVELIAYIQIALRDGTWSAEYAHTFTLTPSNTLNNKNGVHEVPLNAALLPYLLPDAMTSVRLDRVPANVNDTYAGKWYISTLDLHVLGDAKLTTSKDVGTGWVKV